MWRSSLFWARAAWQLARRSRHFVAQNTVTDCGVACALSVLGMHRRAVDALAATDRLDPERSGTSLQDLKRFFVEQHDMPARALAVRADRIDEIQTPAIVHMERMHYLVLLQAGRTGVLCFDPSMGPVFYPRDDFARLYSGFALEVSPGGRARPARDTTPALRQVTGAIGLFLTGTTARLLEAALILSLSVGLFLVANKASPGTLFTVLAVIVVAGLLLLTVRRWRIVGQEAWVWHRQNAIWRRLWRGVVRGRDLIGFRNQRETQVATRLRQALIVAVPKQAQFAAALGTVFMMTILLGFLSPWLSLAYLCAIAGVTGLALLNEVSLVRRTVRAGQGRYSPIAQSRHLPSLQSAQMLFGEVGKWSVIGIAGYGALATGLPAPVMMFWILLAMQLVPADFRAAPALAQGFAPAQCVSPLLGAEAPLRDRRVSREVILTATREKGLVVVDGILPLTKALQHPDLTVREQRLILADVVRRAVASLPESDRDRLGAIRLFGPGQDVSQADFETLALADQLKPVATLPVPADDAAAAQNGPIDRAMQSCGAQDFPVFWDVRNEIALADLRGSIARARAPRAGHLSMTRLTLVEAA